MNGGLIHNKKFNLVAFLSMGLFLLIGFIDIFSWIFIMLPVVVCFYVYDIRHGAVYLTSGEISCFDYILYTVCAVELLCCLTSVYIPNSITATLKILLSIAFYFFIRTFIRFRSQFAFLYKVLSIVAGILSLITLFFFLLHRDEGGNLAASKIRNLECPSYEICLIDYGCGKFNRKIHIMEQYP